MTTSPLLLDCARFAAKKLWDIFGITHDPRMYKCKLCGVPCKWVHSHVTMGYANRLCNPCFSDQNKAGKIDWGPTVSPE